MTDFRLDAQNEILLSNYLNTMKTMHCTDNIEFEVRFGEFTQPQTQSNNKKNFTSNVEPEFFHTLQRSLEKKVQNKLVNKEIIKTREEISESGCRKITNLNTGVVTYMEKQRLKKYDVYDLEIRLSLACERSLPSSTCKNYNYIREKDRTSYTLSFCKIDMTIVDNNKYEIEVEIFKGTKLDDISDLLGRLIYTRQIANL